MTEDNWRHRSQNMRCQGCMYYVEKHPSPAIGRCRRHAPTMGGWPAVFANDWCGDHKIDEHKLDEQQRRDAEQSELMRQALTNSFSVPEGTYRDMACSRK